MLGRMRSAYRRVDPHIQHNIARYTCQLGQKDQKFSYPANASPPDSLKNSAERAGCKKGQFRDSGGLAHLRFVIVIEDCEGGMVDIHDRHPLVLEPDDAVRWMDSETPVEEAAHIAQARSLPTEEFIWWAVGRAVGRAVNRAERSNDGKHLLVPISECD
jgi:hypothetical protein